MDKKIIIWQNTIGDNMCTAIQIKSKYSYFGRNMDIDRTFNEKIIITPTNYQINFKLIDSIKNHFAIIGIGAIIDDYPLYADAMNEKGLSFAGLNFMGNAKYFKKKKNKLNLAPYELPLYILSKYQNVEEIILNTQSLNLVDIDFKDNLPNTPLHFIFSDKTKTIVIESGKDGLKIYPNPFNVLTNNPPFHYHQENIKNYLNLTINDNQTNIIYQNILPYSLNLGLKGLPGDYSSTSRFIKALIIKNNMVLYHEDEKDIKQFFKCLDSVFMIDGIVKTENGYETTRYSICYNLDLLECHYKTYENQNIKTISFINQESNKLIHFLL